VIPLLFRSLLFRWSWRRFVLSFLAVVFSQCLYSLSRAQTAGPVTVSQPSAAVVNYGTTGGSVTPSPLTKLLQQPANINGPSDFERLLQKSSSSTAGVEVTDKVSAQVGGKAVPMSIKRAIPLAAVARAAAKIVLPVAAAVAAKELWDEVRARPHPGDPNVIDMDPGQGRELQYIYEVQQRSGPAQYGSNPGACAGAMSDIQSTPGMPGGRTWSYRSYPDGQCEVIRTYFEGGQLLEYQSYTIGIARKQELVCPEVVSVTNSGSVPWNAPLGPDGKCPTGNYQQSTRAALAASLLLLPSTQEKAPKVVAEAMDAGQDLTADAEPLNGTLSGPAQSSGTPTTSTTTTPEGVTSNSTSTPVSNISYLNNTYNTTTTVVNTTNNAGAVTTTVTTGAAADPGKTDCEKFPDAVGCAKFGELPKDDPKWTDKPIVYAEDSLGLPSGCPPDRHFPLRGWDLVLRYGPLCDVAPTIKSGLVALTALGCMLMVLGALKS
jgi:hypothetical protein